MNVARLAAGVFAAGLAVVVVVAVKPSLLKGGLGHDNVSVGQSSLQSSVDEEPDGAMATAAMVARLATFQAINATEMGATVEPTYAISFLQAQDDVKAFTPTTAEETQFAQWKSQRTPVPNTTALPPTPRFPVPFSEESAIAWAMDLAPPGSSAHSPVARRITRETLVSTFGFDGPLAPGERVWVVGIRTSGLDDLSMGKRLGMVPPSDTTPVPVPGFLVVVSEAGVGIGGGSLFGEDHTSSQQKYSVIANLANE